MQPVRPRAILDQPGRSFDAWLTVASETRTCDAGLQCVSYLPRGLNDAGRTLQNDFDVELVAPDETTRYFPYGLDRVNPNAEATRLGANTVDNVEDIDAPPQTGTWHVRVKGDKLKLGVTQTFAIAVSGLNDESPQ
jgi:hypothetical protein